MSFAPDKIRVGVLRGGPSPEYDVSLNTGKTVLSNLEESYYPLDIFISKEGGWHTGGLEKSPYKILQIVDVVWNAMHGGFGEDGTVQKMLEDFGIPYTGSDSLPSAGAMNKGLAKDIFSLAGLKTPHHIIVEKNDNDIDLKTIINKINESLPFPIIIKPINSGSSFGVSFVAVPSEIKEALINSFAHSPKLLVEEYINGTEVTCGVIADFRDKDIYTLLPVEILKQKEKNFHDYDSKYVDLGLRHQIPGNLRVSEKRNIEEAASLIHQTLGLKDYSRSDFIIHPKRGTFVLEVNTLPELTHRSSFVKSLEAVGSNIKEFISHILAKTLRR